MNIKNTLIILLLSITLFNCEITQEKPTIDIKKTEQKVSEALSFCKSHNHNTEFCILIDMSLHSGVKRFMLWDFNTVKIKHLFLVSHGCCNGKWNTDNSKNKPTFSNTEESHCYKSFKKIILNLNPY